VKITQPPATAIWLLEHAIPGQPNEALAGDLLEEFRNGRTSGWYWSQVLVAVALGWLRESLARADVIAFAALWSIAGPSWFVYTDKIQNDAVIMHALLSRLAFPWSMLGYFGWGLALSMALIWAGIVVYHLLRFLATGSVGSFRLKRNALLSTCVYIALTVVIVTMTTFLPPGHAIDRRTLTPINAITDPRMYAMNARLISFATLLVTLWTAKQRRLGHKATS
jgi:uncharacterized membrane protein YidH (DUF202 family)